MISYHAAHLAAITSRDIPVWDGKLLEDTSTGSILVSDDVGKTWRLYRPEDELCYAGIAMENGSRGEIIKMTSKLSMGDNDALPTIHLSTDIIADKARRLAEAKRKEASQLGSFG